MEESVRGINLVDGIHNDGRRDTRPAVRSWERHLFIRSRISVLSFSIREWRKGVERRVGRRPEDRRNLLKIDTVQETRFGLEIPKRKELLASAGVVMTWCGASDKRNWTH